MAIRIKHYNPSASELVADWHVIDATGEVLGRLATKVAWLLMGKHKPGYVPHLLAGDFVVVTNAASVRVTGDKAAQKMYVRHSQRPGSRTETPLGTMMDKHPARVIEQTVRGMLPRNKLGERMISRLKVYAGPDHPHSAQVIGAERTRARTAEPAAAAATEQPPAPSARRRRTRPRAAAPGAEGATREAPARPARRPRTTAKAAAGEPSASSAPPAKAPSELARRRRTGTGTAPRRRRRDESRTDEDAGNATEG